MAGDSINELNDSRCRIVPDFQDLLPRKMGGMGRYFGNRIIAVERFPPPGKTWFGDGAGESVG